MPRKSGEEATTGFRLVHEPARLAIMASLHVMAMTDFIQLMNETGLSRGNLSSHLSKLEEAGYITVEKTFAGKTPRTLLSLTDAGCEALREYRRTMEPLIAALPK